MMFDDGGCALTSSPCISWDVDDLISNEASTVDSHLIIVRNDHSVRSLIDVKIALLFERVIDDGVGQVITNSNGVDASHVVASQFVEARTDLCGIIENRGMEEVTFD